MTQFTGQISGFGLYGTQGNSWHLTPYYIKAYFTLRNRAYALFGMEVQ